MSVYLSPVGLSEAPVANQLSATAVYREELCKPYCNNTALTTQVGITYTAGTPVLVGTTVFVPITASVSVLSPGNCCQSVPQGYTENFEVSFQGRTALPTSVTVSSTGRVQQPACIDKKGRVHEVVIYDSIVITLT